MLHRFAESVFGNREAARRTVLYLALFPFSVFFTRVYAEALLLLTSVLAVHAAWHGRWATAGVWGALATLATARPASSQQRAAVPLRSGPLADDHVHRSAVPVSDYVSTVLAQLENRR